MAVFIVVLLFILLQTDDDLGCRNAFSNFKELVESIGIEIPSNNRVYNLS